MLAVHLRLRTYASAAATFRSMATRIPPAWSAESVADTATTLVTMSPRLRHASLSTCIVAAAAHLAFALDRQRKRIDGFRATLLQAQGEDGGSVVSACTSLIIVAAQIPLRRTPD